MTEHFMICNRCREAIDLRDLDQVIRHETCEPLRPAHDYIAVTAQVGFLSRPVKEITLFWDGDIQRPCFYY